MKIVIKLVLICHLIIFSNYLNSYVPKPLFNKEVGGITGRLEIFLENQWEDLESDSYYHFKLTLQNIKTKKNYFIF